MVLACAHLDETNRSPSCRFTPVHLLAVVYPTSVVFYTYWWFYIRFVFSSVIPPPIGGTQPHLLVVRDPTYWWFYIRFVFSSVIPPPIGGTRPHLLVVFYPLCLQFRHSPTYWWYATPPIGGFLSALSSVPSFPPSMHYSMVIPVSGWINCIWGRVIYMYIHIHVYIYIYIQFCRDLCVGLTMVCVVMYTYAPYV